MSFFQRREWTWLILALVLLLAGGIRFRLLETPLERDEGEYAYAGQLILQGIPPYELAYNMKLPGTYAAYAAILWLFDESAEGIHLGLLMLNAATILLVYFLGRRLFDNTVGLFAAASFALLSVSPATLGSAAHANHFVIFFALCGLLLLFRALDTRKKRLHFATGLLMGLAFLLKQQGLFFGLFVGALLLLRALRAAPVDRRLRWAAVMYYSAGAVLPFLVTCGLLWAAGVFDRFWFWTFTYASKYATSVPLEFGVKQFEQFLQRLPTTAALWVMGLAGLAVLWLDESTRGKRAFTAGFVLFSFLATAVGLYFRPHYFLLLLPAWTVLIGLTLRYATRCLTRSGIPRPVQFLPTALFAGACAYGLFDDRHIYFQLPPPAVNRALYGPNPFVESVPMSRYIRENSKPGARVAVFGSEPQIYFYSGRHSATGYIYTYPLMEVHPFAKEMQQEMIREIENNDPEFIVVVKFPFSWAARPESTWDIFNWCATFRKDRDGLVGVMNVLASGETATFWGEEARQYAPQSDYNLFLLQRKDTLVAADG